MIMFKKPFLRSPAQALVVDRPEQFLEFNKPAHEVSVELILDKFLGRIVIEILVDPLCCGLG
jgi:hypothetical protein